MKVNNSGKQLRRGILAAGTGVTVLSFDALLIRLSDVAGWEVMFWRGTCLCLMMLCIGLVSGQWKLLQNPVVRKQTLVVAFLYGVTSGLFVLSVTLTRVANTVVIMSVAPFFAAAFSWFILGEVIRLRTGVAIALCVGSVVLVFAGSVQGGGWAGDLLALILAITMGLALTLLRKYPEIPRVPLIALSGVTLVAFAAPFASPFQLEGHSYGWLALMGLVQIPVASVLLLVAIRYLPAPEVSLFLLIETILGPVWVWLVLGEEPPSATLIGGFIVVATIAVHSTLALRELRQSNYNGDQ